MRERLARRHFDRGRQFELQDRVKDAMASYQKACDLEPDFPEPFLALGRMKAARGQLRDAIALLDAAADRSDDPQIRQWRGYVYGRLRRFSESLADYRAIEYLNDPHVTVNIGRMLLALGRYEEAEEVLSSSSEESGKQLYRALPRYREFTGEATDDIRAVRYLFGGTIVMGTLGDGGLRLTGERYQLLSERHIGTTLKRFLSFAQRHQWEFDGVGARGPHHLPVATAMSQLLGLPIVTEVERGTRILVCSAVIKGPTESANITRFWRDQGAEIMHLAIGMNPIGDPNPKEPDCVGFVGRCAVPWYRVEPYTRLETDPEGGLDSAWPGFKVGPAFVNPNSRTVAQELIEAVAVDEPDALLPLIFDWYARHARVRAFDWSP